MSDSHQPLSPQLESFACRDPDAAIWEHWRQVSDTGKKEEYGRGQVFSLRRLFVTGHTGVQDPKDRLVLLHSRARAEDELAALIEGVGKVLQIDKEKRSAGARAK